MFLNFNEKQRKTLLKENCKCWDEKPFVQSHNYEADVMPSVSPRLPPKAKTDQPALRTTANIK
jgi:hypothetical protein